MKSLDLSISIVNYKTYDLIRNCVASVIQHTLRINYEIILVDNASSISELTKLKTEFPVLITIANTMNRGFAAANNQAYNISKGRYFVLLNSDAELLNDALSIMVEHMDIHPDCGISCPQLHYPDLKPQKSFSDFHSSLTRAKWEYTPKIKEITNYLRRSSTIKNIHPTNDDKYIINGIQQIERPRGVCFLIRRATIEDIGVMDERFFMYDEEVDWAYRSQKSGWRNYIFPMAKVKHHWGASTKKRKRLMNDIHTQSDFKYHYKHFGIKGWFTLWIGHIVGIILALILSILYIMSPSKETRSQSTRSFREAKEILRTLVNLNKNINPID